MQLSTTSERKIMTQTCKIPTTGELWYKRDGHTLIATLLIGFLVV